MDGYEVRSTEYRNWIHSYLFMCVFINLSREEGGVFSEECVTAAQGDQGSEWTEGNQNRCRRRNRFKPNTTDQDRGRRMRQRKAWLQWNPANIAFRREISSWPDGVSALPCFCFRWAPWAVRRYVQYSVTAG